MLNYSTLIEDKKGSEGEKWPEGDHDLTRFEKSRPGPNSSGMCHFLSWFQILLLCLHCFSLIVFTPLMLTHRSEGAYPAMGIGKAESLNHYNPKMTSAKIHGCQPQVDSGRSGNTLTHNLSIKKRSLRRAQKRLMLFGHTWYRGQLMGARGAVLPTYQFF